MNNIPYIKEVVVYDAEIQLGKEEKTVICAGVYLDDEIAPSKEQVKQDFLTLNQKLLVYKRIAYVDFVDSEYEKTSTRKIKRDLAEKRHTKDKGLII